MPILQSSRRLRGIRSRTVLAGTALILSVAACDSALEPLIGLFLSQPSVHFRAVRGSAVLQTQTITVSNSGGGRLGPVTCPANPAPWLTCSVAQGNVVTLSANSTGLASSPPPVSVPLEAPGVSAATSLLVDLAIEEPVITLSPNSFAFTATEGSSSATPSATTIQVTNTGAGLLSSFGGLSCVPAQPGSRVNCSVNQESGSLTVAVDPTGLAPGTYVYPLTVSSPNTSVAQNLQVSLRVVALPRIVLSQRSLVFQAVRGLTTSQTQTITVTNGGEGSLGTVSCPASPTSWLSCAVSAGTGGATNVTFTTNPAGVTASPSPATVNISATGAANTPQAVTVTLALEQPLLELSSNTASFSAIEASGGGAVTPTSHVITVSARTAGGTFVSPGTISCIPQGGTIPVTCIPASNQITISVTPGQATPGVYVSSVNVTGSNSNVTQRVTVIVSVTPRPELLLTPSVLTFTVPPGSTTPVTQTVAASNIGGGELGTISCPINPDVWITCTVQGTDLFITVNPTGFVQSPPPVTFNVTASNIPELPKPLTVQLVIAQTMGLSANVANFTVAAGGNPTVPAGTPTAPPSIALQVTNTSGGTLQSLGVIGCSFPTRITCTVNPATGAITITVDPTGLAPNASYPFGLSISASQASNSPLPVTVFLQVTP